MTADETTLTNELWNNMEAADVLLEQYSKDDYRNTVNLETRRSAIQKKRMLRWYLTTAVLAGVVVADVFLVNNDTLKAIVFAAAGLGGSQTLSTALGAAAKKKEADDAAREAQGQIADAEEASVLDTKMRAQADKVGENIKALYPPSAKVVDFHLKQKSAREGLQELSGHALNLFHLSSLSL